MGLFLLGIERKMGRGYRYLSMAVGAITEHKLGDLSRLFERLSDPGRWRVKCPLPYEILRVEIFVLWNFRQYLTWP